jgi:hypothetical protein
MASDSAEAVPDGAHRWAGLQIITIPPDTGRIERTIGPSAPMIAALVIDAELATASCC